MQLPISRIDKCASTDHTRPNLTYVYLDPKREILFATTGQLAVVLNISIPEDEQKELGEEIYCLDSTFFDLLRKSAKQNYANRYAIVRYKDKIWHFAGMNIQLPAKTMTDLNLLPCMYDEIIGMHDEILARTKDPSYVTNNHSFSINIKLLALVRDALTNYDLSRKDFKNIPQTGTIITYAPEIREYMILVQNSEFLNYGYGIVMLMRR